MGHLDYVLYNEIQIMCGSLVLNTSKCEGIKKGNSLEREKRGKKKM